MEDNFNSDVQELEGQRTGEEAMNELANMDYDIDGEYKPEPLCANGNYDGHVTKVSYLAGKYMITWEATLEGNGGLQSDGNTPVDGSRHIFRLLLPKPGDQDEMESNGRVNKRQGKINRMKKFYAGMQIPSPSGAEAARAIQEGDWVGIPVKVTLSINEYMGEVRNQVDKMVRRAE